jgi:drug/metabolite transporter (DMT)-like permease
LALQNGHDLLSDSCFSGVLAYIFLNQAIVLTQVISMGIIIVGLLITNKKIVAESKKLLDKNKLL